MPYISPDNRVESRVKRDFGMGFLPFAQQCKDQGLKVHEVAEMIGCSSSNMRRILCKFGISFVVIEREPLLTDCPKFQNKAMNGINCLSRRWVA